MFIHVTCVPNWMHLRYLQLQLSPPPTTVIVCVSFKAGTFPFEANHSVASYVTSIYFHFFLLWLRCKTCVPNYVVERLTLLLRVLEVLNSNFFLTYVQTEVFNMFTQALPGNTSTESYNTTLLVSFTWDIHSLPNNGRHMMLRLSQESVNKWTLVKWNIGAKSNIFASVIT